MGLKPSATDLRLSGDGTVAFRWTAGISHLVHVDREKYRSEIVWAVDFVPSFTVDGPVVWVRASESAPRGWDLKTLKLHPVQSSNVTRTSGISSEKYHLTFYENPARIIDNVTRKEVFRLPEGFRVLCDVRFDGRYLVAYCSCSVLLDFAQVIRSLGRNF
jgi:hypothetical protein